MEKACLLVCDHRPGMKPDCLIQHALRNIHAGHPLRPLVGCIGAMPPHAAAQVQPFPENGGSRGFRVSHSPAPARPWRLRGIRLYFSKKLGLSYGFSDPSDDPSSGVRFQLCCIAFPPRFLFHERCLHDPAPAHTPHQIPMPGRGKSVPAPGGMPL